MCVVAIILLTLAVRSQMVAKSPVVTASAENFSTLVMDMDRP